MCRRGVVLLLLLLGVAGCKPPRSPREATQSNLTGSWSGESRASDGSDPGRSLQWRLEIEESRGGGIAGSGTVGTDEAEFPVDGIRGEEGMTLRLRMPEEPIHYRGSLTDPRTITGELQFPNDTVPLVLRR